jgi:hypothetical protein
MHSGIPLLLDALVLEELVDELPALVDELAALVDEALVDELVLDVDEVVPAPPVEPLCDEEPPWPEEVLPAPPVPPTDPRVLPCAHARITPPVDRRATQGVGLVEPARVGAGIVPPPWFHAPAQL